MEIVILNTKNINTITVVDLKSKSNCEYLKFILDKKDISDIYNGKTVSNCKMMNKLQNEKFVVVEDCLNNKGKNLNNIKSYEIHKMFVRYKIYKHGKYKIRIRDQ